MRVLHLCFKEMKIAYPHQKNVSSGLPTQNCVKQNFGEGNALPKIHARRGHPSCFETSCRTLPVDPRMCHPTQYFPTCFHVDLVSHGTLHIQTCRSVQIFESAYLGSPTPPEL